MTSSQSIINAMTVDVEDYFHVAAFANDIAPSQWAKMQSRVEKNTISILDLFRSRNTKATFFILGWVAERYPDIVKEIQARGHEVACHGYSHQLIYKQSPELFRDETKKSKDLLEDITNEQVSGYRAASYSITKESLWALDVLTDLGFEYDSSIVPVHHDLYGIPGASRLPYVLTAPNGKMLTEYPPTTLALPGFNLPIAGGGYFRLYPYWFSKAALRWVNHRDKIPFIFYLHPWEIDPDQPRMKGSWVSQFRHYNNLSSCSHRLDKLLSDFRFTTAKETLTELKLIGLDAQHHSHSVLAT